MSSVLIDSSKNWAPNEWFGGLVTLTEGTGVGQVRGIVANTDIMLTVDKPWEPGLDPSAGTKYKITLSYLYGIIRGLDGTEPQQASPGTLIIELKNVGYFFVVAGHSCKAVKTVRIDNVPQFGNYEVSLADTSLVAGKTFTTVRFPSLPIAGVGSGGSGAGDSLQSITVAGTIKSNTDAEAKAPDWLNPSGGLQFMARVSLSAIIDTGVTGLAPNQSAKTITFSGGGSFGQSWASLIVLSALVGTDSRVSALQAVTSVEGGGLSGGTVTAHLSVSNMEFQTSGGAPIQVGSIVITGLTVEFKYKAGQVKSSSGSTIVTTSSGATAGQSGGALTATNKALEQALRQLSVTCDVEGYIDDVSGTITGTPSALVEKPGDIDRHLVSVVLGESLTLFDSASYALAKSFHSGLGYRHTLVISEKTELSQILQESARQSRCWVFTDGGKIFRVFLNFPSDAQMNIPFRALRTDPEWMTTRRESLITKVAAKFDFRWANGTFLIIRNVEVSSLVLYPSIQDVAEYRMVPGIQTGTMINDLLSFSLVFFGRIRRIVRFETYWTSIALEVGDVIAFRPPSPLTGETGGDRWWDDSQGNWWDVANAEHWDAAINANPTILYTMWGGLLFRVFELEIDHNTNTLRVAAIEVNA